MTSIALKFVLVWGWRRLLTAVCFGVLAAAALPPVSFWPALFISMPVLVWLMDGIHAQSAGVRRLWPAFWTGWSFGFGYFLVSLHWIGHAFLVDADAFAWALPFAVSLLPAGLALFWGVAAMLAIWMWQPGFVRIVGLAASLGLLEWLRGTILSGFPWNSPGYAVDAVQSLAQLASVVGIYGVTFLVVLWAASPAALTDDQDHYGQRLSRLASLLLVTVTLIGSLAFGNWRLERAATIFHDDIRLRIIQPNIAQRDKWNPQRREEIISKYLALTRDGPASGSSNENITHVIWPESALPVLIGELEGIRQQIGRLLDGRAVYIMGAITRQAAADGTGQKKAHNSVIAMAGDGAIAGQYHKQQLVPFGEFLPLAGWLEPLGLRKLVTIPTGFSAGPGPQTLSVAGTPAFAALICYEAIFPTAMVDQANRPQWMVNVTNDAWFGHSIGPFQHFAQARMRAIEQGLPMIRAANTGISAVIDSHGRILGSLELGKSGAIDSRLPLSLTPTIYAKYGNQAFILLLGLAFSAVYGHFSRCRKFYIPRARQ